MVEQTTSIDQEIVPSLELTFSPLLFKDSFDGDIPTSGAVGADSFRPYIDDYPTVYVLYSDKDSAAEAYVGETTHLKKRIKSHSGNIDRKRLNRMVAIGCEAFNQSATYNIESNLISCLLADQKFILQNKSQIAEAFTTHNYFQKRFYNEELFTDIWDELISAELAQSSLSDIQNRDIYKLSPYKQLSESQHELVAEVMTFCKRHISDETSSVFLIKGEAGTGKSVVLSSLIKQIADQASEKSSSLFGTSSYFLVNHSEQLKTYHKIAKGIKGLKVGRFKKPTTFVNEAKRGKLEPGITIVDEAHLLLSHSDSYNGFNENNHLEEIIKHSKITIIVYDEKQVLKLKSFWDKTILDQAISPIKTRGEHILSEQFRMQSDEKTLEWIDAFVGQKKILPLPTYADNKDSEGFEFRIFDDTEEMYCQIKSRNKEKHLARMVATFDYQHKKDGKTYCVNEGAFSLPWNDTSQDKTWAEREKSIDEVGSIYTVQGFDLNYVGVILGPSISYDQKAGRIRIIPENYKDTGAFSGRSDIPKEALPTIKEQIILNSVNVLMKRGMKGLYIYASDKALRENLISLQHRA